MSRALIVVASIGMFGAFAAPAPAAKTKPSKPKTVRPVAVYPIPGTPVAGPKTTISFRGLNPDKLGKIKVVGAKSGRHFGSRLVHSDGRGVSFVPKRPFVKGEHVRVKTDLRIYNARKGDYKFKIGQYYGNDDEVAGPGTPPTTDGLHSRPDLKPPPMVVEGNPAQAAPGKFFLSPKEDGLMIVDNYGRTSWFQPTGFGGNGQSVMNFQTQTYRDKPVLTYWRGASSARGFSQVGAYEILNEKYNTIKKMTPGNGFSPDIHEFALTDRNTALTLSYEGVRWDTSKVGGTTDKVLDNVIQEVDIKTGAVMFEWHSLGNVPLNSSAGEPPTDGTAYDYFHANSIKVDGNSYLISGRRSSSIFRIDRATAKIRWQLRGDGGEGSFAMGEGTSFAYQHDARRLPNGNISLFDNGSGRNVPTINEESSGLILKLSGKNGSLKADLVQRYEHPGTPVVSSSQGDIDVQSNGNALVGWGSVARATEFSEAGDVILDITFPEAAVSSYRAQKDRWTGVPKGRPAIASEATGGGTTVWASWNGATQIAEWNVLSGPNENSLDKIASKNWADLETEIAAPAAGAVIAVEAVDKNGDALGQSAAVPVGTQSE
ncbi:MAG: arylsulfotransferase family protein [Thermoleophilia bacterium]|nr:arylsulfotransferase family protein [Thermoleophilia bacterium]